jgi:hypothetical protein
MFTRSNPLLNRIPPPIRNLILALLIIGSLLLPELRPVLTLVLVVALPIGAGLLVALPVLLPPLRRLGQDNPAARRAEIAGFGVAAFCIVIVVGTALLPAVAARTGVPLAMEAPQDYVILGGLALLPALACAAFVGWFTASDPAAPEGSE